MKTFNVSFFYFRKGGGRGILSLHPCRGRRSAVASMEYFYIGLEFAQPSLAPKQNPPSPWVAAGMEVLTYSGPSGRSQLMFVSHCNLEQHSLHYNVVLDWKRKDGTDIQEIFITLHSCGQQALTARNNVQGPSQYPRG